MPLYRAQVVLATVDGIPENFVTNTMYFFATNLTEVSALADEITDFYQEIDGFLSSRVATTGHEIKWYDMTDPEPRIPVQTDNLGTLTINQAQTQLPSEVAIVASFQGDKEAGSPQARRRGRIYLGPWSVLVLGTGADDGLIASSVTAAIRTACINLQAAAAAIEPLSWSVYSPTDGGSVGVPITNGWVSNEFDTQRRRGIEATSRNAWTASA